MSRKRRMQSLRESKDRRAKRLAVAGGVVLAALLAWEVPHYVGGGSATPAPATSTPSAGAAPSTPTATTPAGSAAAAVTPVAQTRLPSSDLPPRRTKSQLAGFSLFHGKDPFVPQITTTVSPVSPPPAGSGGHASSSSSSGGTGAGATVRQAAARTLARSGSATIEVNGASETVAVGAAFPRSNPVFRLVSLAGGVARIGIANGSYASGAQTVALTAGRPLTLVDTADGTRYVLRLVLPGS